jgi:hypothetical protein
VAREVEDHLREAVAADPACDEREAERAAVAAFGEPRALALQFAAITLARRTRRVGLAVVLAVVAVLAAMKLRVAWYAAMEWTLSEEMRPLAALVLAVDRTAFWLAVVIGLGTFLYIGSRRVAGVPDAACRKQHRLAVFLCGAAVGSIAVTVIGDGVLTAFQLGSNGTAQWVVPVVSLAFEMACVAAVVAMMAVTVRRAAQARALLGR